MKMLKHRITGMVYNYHEFMAKAEEIEVIDVPDEAPEATAPRALEKMNHAELLAMAMKLSGEGGPVEATMKRAELIAYIKGEDL